MNLLTDILPLGKGSGDLYLIIYLNKYIAKYIRHVNIRTIGKNVENIIRIGEGLIIFFPSGYLLKINCSLKIQTIFAISFSLYDERFLLPADIYSTMNFTVVFIIRHTAFYISNEILVYRSVGTFPGFFLCPFCKANFHRTSLCLKSYNFFGIGALSCKIHLILDIKTGGFFRFLIKFAFSSTG